jgi:glycosyltransferase involved in cell wall biosynthesis
MEAQAAGLACVAPCSGAIGETLGGVGAALPPRRSDEYRESFISYVVNGLCSKETFEKMSAAGRERSSGFSWAGVAAEWAKDGDLVDR